jgi:MFS family permease
MASDRTPIRFGRRSTWVVIGTAGSIIGLVVLGVGRTALGLGLGFVVAIAFVPVIVVPLYASIADRVVAHRRGAIGAVVGAATILGGVAGNLIAARLADRTALGTMVFAALLLAGAVAIALFGGEPRESDDPAAARAEPPEPRPGAVRAGGTTPRRPPDFAWFAIGRFALFLGYALVAMLAYYILRDYVGHPDPVNGVATFAIVTGSATLLGALVAGPWSDRAGRRKPFVIAAAALVAAGVALPALSPSLTTFMVAAAVIGLGFGAYIAAGTALATLVLPREATVGRDLGLIGLANASATAIAPLAGAYLATSLGYPAMFALAGLACLVAMVAILPIRSVA